jgi:hypothetical protein
MDSRLKNNQFKIVEYVPKKSNSTASTPGSPSKFLMAAFVRLFAQKVTAEICPVQPFVMLF